MDQDNNLVVKCLAKLTTDLKQKAWECDLELGHEGPQGRREAMATIRETQTERFNRSGVLKVDGTGRVLTRREYIVEGTRHGRTMGIGRFSTRKEAETCAKQEEQREAMVSMQHLSGWVGCSCPDCRR